MYRIELYERELRSTSKGREILSLITKHIEEVSRLINHNRDVTVTWQRNKGPQFFTQFMGSGFDTSVVLKKENEHVSLASLIRRMAVVLQDYGSRSLVETIDTYLLIVLEYTETCDSLKQLFEKLKHHG